MYVVVLVSLGREFVGKGLEFVGVFLDGVLVVEEEDGVGSVFE